MAEEKARPTRGRKRTDNTGAADEAVTAPRARKVTAKASEATGPKAAKKTATKKTATKRAAATRMATPRAKRAVAVVPEPTVTAIAERAYLLWERGEPGDQTEHWLRAEAELRAA